MAHLDWLSYTVQTPPLADFPNAVSWSQHLASLVPDYFGFESTALGTARRPGTMVGADVGRHSYVWLIRSGYILVEHTGKGCEFLRQEELLDSVLVNAVDAISRIDLAIDYDTDIQPEQVAAERQSARQSARSSMVSATGATEYIGSRRSDRYMRIYRYAPPHPRAAFLRLEYVLKKDYARTAVAALNNDSTVSELAAGQREHYGLNSAFILADESEPYNLAVEWEARSASKTLQWLYGPVAASIKRLSESGDFDLDEFLAFLRR